MIVEMVVELGLVTLGGPWFLYASYRTVEVWPSLCPGH